MELYIFPNKASTFVNMKYKYSIYRLIATFTGKFISSSNDCI